MSPSGVWLLRPQGEVRQAPGDRGRGCHWLATLLARPLPFSEGTSAPAWAHGPWGDQSQGPYAAASCSRQFQQQQNGCPLAPPTSEHQTAQFAQRERWDKLQGSPLPPQQPDNGATAGREELTDDITREAADGRIPGRRGRWIRHVTPPLLWEQEIGKEGQDPSTTHPTAPQPDQLVNWAHLASWG